MVRIVLDTRYERVFSVVETMDWDRNEGRYTCTLVNGWVAHAVQLGAGWEVLVPAAGIHEVVRNPNLKTWLSARSVVERVIRARIAGESGGVT